MKRITVEEARRAYKRAGIAPVRYEHISDDKTCGCLWGAMALANGIDPSECHGAILVRWSEENYGAEYRAGAVCGFDGHKPESVTSCNNCGLPNYSRYMEGYEDGRAVADAIFSEAQA